MSQTVPKTEATNRASASPPQAPLSTQRQAIELAKAQAEQRVRLGVKLLQAAETQTTHQQRQFEAFKKKQQQAREQLQNDIASTLQTYDQWMARFDESFTGQLKAIEERVKSIETKWIHTENRISSLLSRIESLLDQRQPPPATAVKPKPQCLQTKPDPPGRAPGTTPQQTQPPPPTTHEHKPQVDTIYRDALEYLQGHIRPPSS